MLRPEHPIYHWIKSHGAKLTEFSYARPEAAGNVAAAVIEPAVNIPPGTPLTIFVHATGNDRWYPHSNILRLLVGRNLPVMTFDLDGHGQDSSTVLRRASALSMVDAAVHEAARRYPHRPVQLIGHSLGAALALEFAARNSAGKTPLSRMILISLPLVIRMDVPALLEEGATPFRRIFQRCIAEYGVTDCLPAIGPFRRGRFPVRTGAGAEDSYIKVVRAIIADVHSLWKSADINIPVLAIHGEKDFLAPLAEAAVAVNRMGTARMVTVPGANHFLTSFAPETEAAIADFIGEGS